MSIHYRFRNMIRDRKMSEAFARHKNLERIAKQFGISIAAARNALKKEGHAFSKKKLRKTSACHLHRGLVFQMCAEGCSLAEIGKRIGTGGRHVKRFLREHGIGREFPVGVRGANHPNWKGGRTIDKHGYVLVRQPDHPRATKWGYVREHRLVMEKAIGRLLARQEVVHHRDGDPGNNAIENLQLFSENSEHLAHELTGKTPNWTKGGVASMKRGIAKSSRLRRGESRGLPTPDAVQWPKNKNHQKS